MDTLQEVRKRWTFRVSFAFDAFCNVEQGATIINNTIYSTRS